MSRRGMGSGSALIMLVFAVLCLTVFALISLTTATADRARADAAADAVKSYYRADNHAERILAEILEADVIPDTVLGVEIETGWDAGVEYVTYLCPISDIKGLYVEVAISGDSYDILKWQMRDTGRWEAESGLPVWIGD